MINRQRLAFFILRKTIINCNNVQQYRYLQNSNRLSSLILDDNRTLLLTSSNKIYQNSLIKLIHDQQQQQQQQIKQQKQKDQFIHDHLNSSQDTSGGLSSHFQHIDNIHLPISEQDLVSKEPPRERLGVLKAIIIIIAGIYFGAWVAMIGVKLLEDLDIFVHNPDDDEDD